MTKIHSEGKCLYCGESFSKQSISRHLNKHLIEMTGKPATGKSFHSRIEPVYGFKEMFLNLLVDGETTIGDIDNFLRDIWLECCGHMSNFVNSNRAQKHYFGFDLMDAYELLEQGKVKQYEKIMEEQIGEVPKSRKVKQAFIEDLKLDYEYDFGSTTKLQLKVIEEFAFKSPDKITLLSRNEPIELLCVVCGKEPAVVLCSVCWEDNMFCKTCAKKHKKECNDFADYAAMPVVNSPRMGVCAYEGGIIDTGRDGVFKKR